MLQTSLFFEYFCSIITCVQRFGLGVKLGGGGGGVPLTHSFMVHGLATTAATIVWFCLCKPPVG